MGKDTTAASSDFIEVPDYNVQHKFLTTALTLKKRLEQQTNTVNIDKLLVLDGTTAPTDTTVIEGQEVTTQPIEPVDDAV
jgi:hypothetical protein